MKSLLDEIEIFKKHCRLESQTIRNYSYALKAFTEYLSIQMNVEESKIYLDKVYILKDSMGTPIRYLPIDYIILEEYFNSLIPFGYYKIKLHHAALSSLFSFLERNDKMQNPMKMMDFRPSNYRPDKKYSKVLSRGEILKLFNSIITNSRELESDLLLFALLLTTGCRISEILDLKCNHIDFENDSFLIVSTKNKHQRIVNLRPNMGEILKNFIMDKNRELTDFLFYNDHLKRKYSRNDVDSLLKGFLSYAKLPVLNIHALRHTFATLMADENTPIIFIQQMLGHLSLNSTKDYINPHYIRNRNFNISENQKALEEIKEKLSIINFKYENLFTINEFGNRK